MTLFVTQPLRYVLNYQPLVQYDHIAFRLIKYNTLLLQHHVLIVSKLLVDRIRVL
jgi:hypothetical protein